MMGQGGRFAIRYDDPYAGMRIGLADASLVVLAERHSARDVLTLDERHFRALRTRDRKRFRLLLFDVRQR